MKVILLLLALNTQGEIYKESVVNEFTSMEQCRAALQVMRPYPNTIVVCMGVES